jgi:predicted  nucleic acid-binding Zn-ribbon protein
VSTSLVCPVCGELGHRNRPDLGALDATCLRCGWHFTTAAARIAQCVECGREATAERRIEDPVSIEDKWGLVVPLCEEHAQEFDRDSDDDNDKGALP